MNKLDRFIIRHPILSYSIALPIGAVTGFWLAIALWAFVMVPLMNAIP